MVGPGDAQISMTDRSFADTNIWVYAVDGSDPLKQARARAILEPTPDKDIVVSAQVLGEFFVVVTGKLARNVSESAASAMVQRMASLPVVAIDGALVSAAISGSRAWQVAYWDALIIAAAETAGCRLLFSEDLAHGRTYGSVTVENPFAQQG